MQHQGRCNRIPQVLFAKGELKCRFSGQIRRAKEFKILPGLHLPSATSSGSLTFCIHRNQDSVSLKREKQLESFLVWS